MDRIDTERGVGVFIQTNRAALSGAVLLDPRWDRRGAPQRAVPLAELRSFQSKARPPAILWHGAFCCSTLLASCLDVAGASLALGEPMALVDLEAARRRNADGADDELVTAVFCLLGRGFAAAERVVIKPSSSANTLAPAAAMAGGPMLFLYSSCRDFILSVAGGGPAAGGAESRRRFARERLAQRVLADRPSVRWRPKDLFAMSDLQVAAVLWHVQVAEFRAVARALGPQRAQSLNCDAFVADPRRGLEHLDQFFDLGLGADRIQDIATGAKLSRHANQPDRSFDADERRRGFARLEAEMGATIGDLVAWSYRMCPETPRGDPVGASLMTVDA